MHRNNIDLATKIVFELNCLERDITYLEQKKKLDKVEIKLGSTFSEAPDEIMSKRRFNSFINLIIWRKVAERSALEAQLETL